MKNIFTMNNLLYLSFLGSLFYTITSAPNPDGVEQLEITDIVTVPDNANVTVKVIQDNTSLAQVTPVTPNKTNDTVPESYTVKVYRMVSDPIFRIIKAPKVNAVLRNIGTCLVNGAMELFSYYLPPTLMPLIASAAGFVIPFEPVVMLKERMPVNTYRRAFKTAMNTFLNSFDHFKTEDEIDPYMTRRFNRRFLDDNNNNKQDNKL